MHLASMLPVVAAAPPAPSEPAKTPGAGLGVFVLGLFALGGLIAFRYRVRAPSGLPPIT